MPTSFSRYLETAIGVQYIPAKPKPKPNKQVDNVLAAYVGGKCHIRQALDQMQTPTYH